MFKMRPFRRYFASESTIDIWAMSLVIGGPSLGVCFPMAGSTAFIFSGGVLFLWSAAIRALGLRFGAVILYMLCFI